MIRAELLINGQPCQAAQGGYFAVSAPADGKVIGQAAMATAEDVDKAVTLACEGFTQWSALAPSRREACLLKAADLVEQQGMERLLDLLIDESGSTITKARNEIRYTVDLLRTAAGEARRLYGDTFPNDNPNRISMVFRQPPLEAALRAKVQSTPEARRAGASQVAAVFRAQSAMPFTSLPAGSTFQVVWPDGSTETMVIVDPSSPNGVRPLAGSQVPAEAADRR